MCTLREANRALLEAIETPPETGEERRLDRIAADLWEHARDDDRLPDPGWLCRRRHDLLTIAERTTEDRARHVRRARGKLGEYAAENVTPPTA